MVVCKCRKATKWYCFVHKTPVCGECICQDQHTICVVKTYSEWVIDGDYDWPPKCAVCGLELAEGENSTVRLACLHVLHAPCLKRHVQSFPPLTAPAGYVCPSCPTVLWPPKDARETTSALGSKLKGVLSQTEVADVLLTVEAKGPPPGVSTPASPDMAVSASQSQDGGEVSAVGMAQPPAASAPDTAVNVGPANAAPAKAQTTSRKIVGRPSALAVDGPGSSYRDMDAADMKYARRGSWYTRTLQQLVPAFFSTQGLPLHNKPETPSEEGGEQVGRKRRRREGIDASKLVLGLAIVSCLATMLLLFFRLS